MPHACPIHHAFALLLIDGVTAAFLQLEGARSTIQFNEGSTTAHLSASCSGNTPAVSFIQPSHVSGFPTGNISLELIGVPSTCIGLPLTTPCVPHLDAMPALFVVHFTGVDGLKAHSAAAKPLLTLVEHAGVALGVSVSLSVAFPDAPTMVALAGGAYEAPASLAVSVVHANQTTLPFKGLPDGDCVILTGLTAPSPPAPPALPPTLPPSPTIPPPSPPPASPLFTSSGLELHLDASDPRSAPALGASCGGGSRWCDISGAGHGFQAVRGGINFGGAPNNEPRHQDSSSEFSGCAPSGGFKYFDFYLGGQYAYFNAYMWDGYKAAAEMTWEVWIWGNSNDESGIIGNYLNGHGKCNYMWQSGLAFHNNGHKGWTNTASNRYENQAWSRFALRYTTTRGYEFIVNNFIVATQPASGSLAISQGGYIGIGAREDGAQTSNSRISKVRIYTRALSNSELKDNFAYDAPTFGQCVGGDVASGKTPL